MLGHYTGSAQRAAHANADRSRPEGDVRVEHVRNAEAVDVSLHEPFGQRHPRPGADPCLGERVPGLHPEHGHILIVRTDGLKVRFAQPGQRHRAHAPLLDEHGSHPRARARDRDRLILDEDAAPWTIRSRIPRGNEEHVHAGG